MGGYKAKDIFRKIIKNRSYHAGMPDVPCGTRALRAKEGDGRGPLKAKSRKRPSRGYGEQAAEDAEDGVERGVAHFALRYQGEGLEREGGEGGETAAETRGEEHAQVGVHDVSALKQCVEQTYDKTSEHIDNHCAPRETGGDTGLHRVREQISRHSSRKAPGTYKQQYS